MIEGAIVATFLAMTFVLVVGVGGLYRAKLRAAHEARFRNTFNATKNCEPEGSSLDNAAVLPEEPDTSALDGGVRRLLDLSRTLVHGGGLSRLGATQEFSFGPVDSTGQHLFSKRVSWRSTMACNAAPVSPNPLGIAESLGLGDSLSGMGSALAGPF